MDGVVTKARRRPFILTNPVSTSAMDEPLQIRLETASGKVCWVTPKRSATMRMVIAETFGPVPGTLFCLLRGQQLQLDLSIASQGIQPHDTIHVVYGRWRPKQRELESERARRHEKGLFEEALRVSDVAFLLFETSRRSNLLYSAFAEETRRTQEKEVEQSVVENSQRISEAPLPPCWLEPEGDESGQLVVKSCCPAKEPIVARELTKEGDCL